MGQRIGALPGIQAEHGIDTVVTRPTTLLVGERNRPERVSVTPLSGGGGGQGMGDVHVHFHGPISDRDTFERIAVEAIGKAVRKHRNTGGLNTEINKALQ